MSEINTQTVVSTEIASGGAVQTKKTSRMFKHGWESTKLHLALITMGLMTAAFLLVVFRLQPGGAVDGLFSTYVMGVLAGAGIYSASNVASTAVNSKGPPS